MKNTVVTFGEVMGRLAPTGGKRLIQCLPGQLDVTFAGAEANVAVSLAQLGISARFVSAVPRNDVADGCIQMLQGLGVDTRFVVRSDVGRMGLYFVEGGANQRPSRVVYDRDHSSISMTSPEKYAWSDILRDACWFHISGITPAVSRTAAEATLASVQTARESGVTVSCDLNFRKKLWRWEPSSKPRELAQKTMREILPLVDVVVANEEDAADVLDIRAGTTDVDSGELEIERYPDVAHQIKGQFPNITHVGITLRESFSASHNNWGAMLFDASTNETYFAPMRGGEYEPYEIRNIVDRVGAGDAFSAGLICALISDDMNEPADALRFAVAASCLAHSIPGDFNLVRRDEIEALVRGAGSGRVVR